VLQKNNPTQSKSYKKCSACGYRNFPEINQCRRCKSQLSHPLNPVKKDSPMPDKSGELGRSTYSLAWILAALVAVLLGLVMVYMRQGAQTTPEQVTEAVAEPAAPDAKMPEQPAQGSVEQEAESKAAAIQVMAELKHFQDATESGMDYSEYDKKLAGLSAKLNSTMPTLVLHKPNGETFRQEVAAALRDYTAAKNWWRTTMANSSVLTEADRNERTQRNWASARAHLTTAEEMLRR
jgi:cytoskeletal protein RodZ